MSNKKILLIEICNYDDYPIGGYLSFAKQMLSAFGNQLVLVGLTTDKNTPVGIWTKKDIQGVTYDFFAVMYTNKSTKKGLIPSRLKSYLAIKKYKQKILSYNVKKFFIQTPEVLLALKFGTEKNLCTRIPGLENPLSISRYSYSKYFSSIFDKIYFKELKKSNIILATGDEIAIKSYIKRSKGVIDSKKVIKFPSRINTNIFKPKDVEKTRSILGWDLEKTYIVTTGRLSELKGWKFMLDCFVEYKKSNPDSHFVFIGDGEDKERILKYLDTYHIVKDVTITGRVSHTELSNYLNAANLYIMGSFVEGWSTALVEAISCGKPVVCTEFSSASELIDEGVNGFVIKNRNKKDFVNAMVNSQLLPKRNLIIKSEEMKEFSTDFLKRDILKYWKLK